MKAIIMRKTMATLMATAVVASSFGAGVINSDNGALFGVNSIIANAESTSSVTVTASAGYAEGAYAEWKAVSGASGYNVYADGYKLDSMLIRQYSSCFRADALGLKSGSHTLKIVPIINGKEDSSKSASVNVNTSAHDRSGFGFVNGTSSGAYNDNGSLKSNATVIYVTNANKDSVTVTLPNKSGTATTLTGVQNILTNLKSNSKVGPVCIRFIGNIQDPANMPSGDLYVDAITCGLTIEGIGKDATFNGFGIVVKNSSNVEIRNLGFMNCNSSEGDNVGLQQKNDHVWVHHCDMFYGDAGSDADQAKGDGALDTKTSSYITHSYNHFWDNGKCNLQGMKSETTSNYITYHHNWYDHSDSRHPRIRTCTVHIYNNYFDGNAKYGVGMTLGGSAFVENNYFRNCKYPMLISMQGSDNATGGTFSGENGGVIKSYNNKVTGDKTKGYVTYQQNSTDFDAYEAKSATEQVPSYVKAKQGGSTYNNFETSSVMYKYSAQSPEAAAETVKANAGRVQGGDFKWTFNNSVDDESSSLNTGLKSALKSYKDSIVAIGSGFSDSTTPSSGSDSSSSSKPDDSSSSKPDSSSSSQASVPASSNVHNFTTNGTSSSFFSITGNLSTSKGTVNYGGQTLNQCLKLESSTSISFNAPAAGKLTLVFAESTGTIKLDGNKLTASNGVITADVSAGSHILTKADTANLFYMAYSTQGGSSYQQPDDSSQHSDDSSQSSGNTGGSTGGNNSSTTINGVKAVSAGGWNESLYVVFSGLSDSDVTGVSYSGTASGKLTGNDLKYLVRDTSSGLRVDIPGVPAGTYSVTLNTTKGTIVQSGLQVNAQDRSGYAHYNYTAGVGAYNDNGTLKSNAIVLYVTNDNKDSVSVTSKDGTTVTGIGNILNSVGQDAGSGKTSNGGKANSNKGIIKKLAQDGTPLVIRIIGDVKAPSGLTAYDSVDYGGSVGDNGYMARMKSGKDITIEGIGTDATINGWGFHFICESSAPSLGKSFEVKNIAFKNVPEDCIGMEGVQESSTLTASVERCWIHNCEFYAPSISNPAESDKAGGDGACDFKRGQYFTNSYCYYQGYHKTNLVGSSDSSLQYHLTYHHNYWNKCESRGPLARQANIHMYNNIFSGQTSYCMNPRANAYIFSEYNIFDSCKNPMQVKLGAVKSFNDVFNNCNGDMQGTIVSSKSTKVNTDNKYANFDTNSSICYIPSGNYFLQTDTSKLSSYFNTYGGTLDATTVVNGSTSSSGTSQTTTPTLDPNVYPVIKSIDYNEQYHQIRFTWNPVQGASNYGIAVYLAGKWRVQTSAIPASTLSFTTPKNLTPNMTYKVAIAAKINGEWTSTASIKHAVTVTVR
jgi:pectate lyase